jgi:hypothetical protein
MRTISHSEFLAHPEMYFDMAVEQGVRIRKGRETFSIVHTPSTEKQPVLQPDEDLRRALTAEELLEGIHDDIRRKYAARQA